MRKILFRGLFSEVSSGSWALLSLGSLQAESGVEAMGSLIVVFEPAAALFKGGGDWEGWRSEVLVHVKNAIGNQRHFNHNDHFRGQKFLTGCKLGCAVVLSGGWGGQIG